MAGEPCVVVDRSHLGRRASGLERVTRDLFSDGSLSPLRVRGTRPEAGRLSMMLRQLVLNPIEAWREPASVWVFPGFPPSPAFGRLPERCVLYVHDLFLVERPSDLNAAGRFYMAPAFRSALGSFRFFMANSATTADRLRPHIAPQARVTLYRPPATDALGVSALAGRPPAPPAPAEPVRIGMIGTVEPRKNYPAAAAIRARLAARLGRPVELHVVGRPGWGEDWARLTGIPEVRLHGFVADGAMPALVGSWDLFLSTSHDEGLGLPLLEAQHAGLPIAAPDQPVFREVLGDSGVYVDPGDPDGAAETIAALLADGDRLARARPEGRRNIARWNALASADHGAVIEMLAARLDHAGREARR